MAKALPKRSDVPRAFTWDLESLYATPDDWERAFQHLEAQLSSFEQYAGRLTESPHTLLAYLQHYEALAPEYDKLYNYAERAFDVDTTNQEASARVSRARSIHARFAAANAFVRPELLTLESERFRAFVEQVSELARYQRFYDEIQRSKPHVRSAEVEAVMAQAGEVFAAPYGIYTVLANADLKFAKARTRSGRRVPVAQGNIEALLSSPDRALRKSAWERYADAYLAHANTFAEIMAAKVKASVLRARVHRFNSVLEAALHPSNIPTAVYHNVIDACNRHIGLWHRYWDARRRALNLDKMEVCDIFAPLAKPPRVPYAQAVQWIVEGLRPLGADYVETVRAGLTSERWVDVYPNLGKRDGAYSSGAYGTKPFIFMNYDDHGLSGLSTLAHEIGHSMHTLLSWQNQPYLYAEYTIFAAEVASNCNQALVRAHLLSLQRGREFEIAVVQEAIDNFHRYLFLMPILAQFEHWMHTTVEQGGALTADAMSEKMVELFRRGYGDAVRLDEPRVGVTWMQFVHFFTDYYVWQYASGISAANAIADMILSGTPEAAERYLTFLKSGGALDPLDALRLAGVDMTQPEPLERAFGVLERFIARFEQLTA
ncbi:MAG: oligoendopeptidase F [Thermoflexales bacterium]|nr:oligoendopeptidase F [Thermoflexales bacterium]MDW8291564.1 oligoendopeptidase F [Anaerolineae bacterium]